MNRSIAGFIALVLLLAGCRSPQSPGAGGTNPPGAPPPAASPAVPPGQPPDTGAAAPPVAAPGQPPAPGAGPPPVAPPGQTPAPGAAAPPALRPEELAALPAQVREWAERFRAVEVGVARTFGPRTYLLVSQPNLCPDGISLSFWPEDARVEGDELVVPARFSCLPAGSPGQSLVVGSMTATSQPVRFELRYSWLPAFRNPHNVPEVPLPAGSRGVLVEPATNSQLAARVRVRGFAARLFEGTVVVRLVTPAGEVVREVPTIAAGGMGPDWGSFAVELDAGQLPPGPYWLEIGDYSMQDGTWQPMDRVQAVRP